ncbi:hypothetical protein CHUAL_000126 [Chamberlinius hualienensis]
MEACGNFDLSDIEVNDSSEKQTTVKDDLKSQISVLRKELQNIRIKQLTLDKLHQKFTNDVQIQLQQSSVNSDNIRLQPIGYLDSPFSCKNATPRQPSLCDQAKAKVKLITKVLNNPSHALEGLQHFSHVWLIFVFHQNKQGSYKKGKVAPPRLNGKKMGVYATRSPHRINPLGLSLVKLDKIEGDTLYLSGIDMIDGTPILDIKPYIPCYDDPNKQEPSSSSSSSEPQETEIEEPVSVAQWIQSPEVEKLNVRFTPTAENQISSLIESDEDLKSRYPNPKTVQSILTDILREDPRSVYRRNRCQQLLYYFIYDVFHLTCWVDDGSEEKSTIEVVKVDRIKT